MTEDELVGVLMGLPGAAVVTAGEENGAPEVAWGDSFFYYEPDNVPTDRRNPFATIVVKDYPGFDTASDINRDGVYRLNLNVGRHGFEEALGYPPAAFEEHRDDVDYTALDQVMPHPVYAKQGWLSILVPGERTAGKLPGLIDHAYQRAKARHKG